VFEPQAKTVQAPSETETEGKVREIPPRCPGFRAEECAAGRRDKKPSTHTRGPREQSKGRRLKTPSDQSRSEGSAGDVDQKKKRRDSRRRKKKNRFLFASSRGRDAAGNTGKGVKVLKAHPRAATQRGKERRCRGSGKSIKEFGRSSTIPNGPGQAPEKEMLRHSYRSWSVEARPTFSMLTVADRMGAGSIVYPKTREGKRK